MLASLTDAIHLIHAPVGCSFYGSVVRKKSYVLAGTDLIERDIVFGAAGKLRFSILEAVRLHPQARAVLVYASCASGLIGEDLPHICQQLSQEVNLPVIPIQAPGFAGCSQAHGHDLAASALLHHLVGKTPGNTIPQTINLLGEFDVQGDLHEIERLLHRLGVHILNAFTGKTNIAGIKKAHQAALNVVHCQRTGGLLAEEMKKRYQIPCLKVSFFGLEETQRAVQSIAGYFGAEPGWLQEETDRVRQITAPYQRVLRGKRIVLYLGASRMGGMATAFRELGMEVIVAGSQFGCQADYSLARSRLASTTRLVDDPGESELAALLQQESPDLMAGGLKEKHLAVKLGIPFLVLPQETAAYAGLGGFVNLAKETTALIQAPVWSLIKKETKVLSMETGSAYIAVASRSGLSIDQHFGRAEQFLIFAKDQEDYRLVEVRHPLTGQEACSLQKAAIEERLRLLADCHTVICQQAGACVQERAVKAGMRIVESDGLLAVALRSRTGCLNPIPGGVDGEIME